MNDTKTGTLRGSGVDLHFEVRGTGPLLLISQSGEGDAGRSVDLVDHLVEDHTVVTYDRRGLSRSRLADPERGVTMAEHADDVHRLLASLTDEPALMLGCSLGAVIGLHLAVRHPGQVSTLIAHEPVAPRLLPDAERIRHERELRRVREIHRRDGLAPAVTEIARVLGIDPENQETEPGLTRHPFTPERIADFGFFIEHDFGAVVEDTLNPAEVRDTPTRVIPAAGRTTPRTVFDHRCARELADLVGVALEEFPGGHNGNLTHPRAYAARVRELLTPDTHRRTNQQSSTRT
ncbi:alpha/beta hydrolase [Streptosporangium sp. NPDC051022]|uniref:alpha/beta fold hydrolase n=1 Tax=Streptosporangium sp. NPDC051022 TaxID=3155752 RepID=UPI00342BDB3F